ncbi:hypothetical protein JCM11491_001227 [Sporobolomyces phaffii]
MDHDPRQAQAIDQEFSWAYRRLVKHLMDPLGYPDEKGNLARRYEAFKGTECLEIARGPEDDAELEALIHHDEEWQQLPLISHYIAPREERAEGSRRDLEQGCPNSPDIAYFRLRRVDKSSGEVVSAIYRSVLLEQGNASWADAVANAVANACQLSLLAMVSQAGS